MKATYEPELVDDLEVPNIPVEQREGKEREDVHGSNAPEETSGSDIQEEEQRDEDNAINEGQTETSHKHQQPYRTSSGRVIKCPKRYAEFVKL